MKRSSSEPTRRAAAKLTGLTPWEVAMGPLYDANCKYCGQRIGLHAPHGRCPNPCEACDEDRRIPVRIEPPAEHTCGKGERMITKPPRPRQAKQEVKKLKPSERIKQIAEERAAAAGFIQPQISISDVCKYLDEVDK